MNKSKGGFSPMRLLGSLSFAVILLAALALLLIVSTFIESRYGTAVAQRLVYQTGWFDAFLALLGVNITCSTLTRWPFKKKHTGFVITHSGILLVLAGSLLTRLLGAEGQLYVPEGQTSDRIFLGQYEVVVEDPRQDKPLATFLLGRSNKAGALISRLPDGTEVRLAQVVDSAQWDETYEEGPVDAAANPAVRLSFTSKAMGASFDFGLVRNHPERPDGHLSVFGPATAVLAETEPADKPSVAALSFIKDGVKIAELPLAEISKDGPTPLGTTGYSITAFEYYPDARVGGEGGLVSVSDTPSNPAVRLHLTDAEGRTSHHLKFANYPDFESMHRKDGDEPTDVRVEFKSGASHEHHGATFTIYPKDGGWHYRARSRQGDITARGEVEIGKTVDTGWADFQVVVTRIYQRAQVRPLVKPSSSSSKYPASRVIADRDGATVFDQWIGPDHFARLPGEHPLILSMRQRSLAVPFSVTLKDFRKVDYPGTRRAASFESDVVLSDASVKTEIHRTIRMNEPMDYAGYRIFQSSYLQEPSGEASIFTVAKNPGVTLLYTGSTVLFIGTFITFFVPALSSFRHEPKG